MFESICLGRPGQFTTAGLGLLAECLLYYRQVHLVLDHQGFKSLVRLCGPDTLLGLVLDGHLDVIYQENRLGVATKTIANVDQHSFIAFEAPRYAAQNHVPAVLEELLGKPGKARRIGSRILQRLTVRKYDPSRSHEWLADIEGTTYTDQVASALLETLAPSYRTPKAVEFRVHSESGSYVVATNIDFAAANEIYRRANPDSTLTPALILSYLYEGIANVVTGAEHASELVTEPFEALLSTHKIGRIIDNATRSTGNIERFQEFVLPTRSVGQVIASGERNFEDLRHLINKAAEFREWTHKMSDDADILREYVAACSSLSWLDKLPNRMLKYLLFSSIGLGIGLTVAGLPGALAGFSLNAVDSFLFDKLVSGWKPSQFIGGSLVPFVNPRRLDA
ncbi:hypothetical protein [Paludibaculum fermentans]|uniref:hypothetical protein n=1 Tax=Paludibaculum fermentans TaxID=1473598 RepID=UPI003EB9118B